MSGPFTVSMYSYNEMLLLTIECDQHVRPRDWEDCICNVQWAVCMTHPSMADFPWAWERRLEDKRFCVFKSLHPMTGQLQPERIADALRNINAHSTARLQ